MPTANPRAQSQVAPAAFTLTVTPQKLVVLSAENAKAADIGPSLEKALRVPVRIPVLDVSVKDGLVSIRARRHMVTAILLDVASKAGIGFETRGQLDQEFIDVDVRGLPVDQLPATLARPNFGVLMRKNLAAGESRPVAVLLGTEATKVKK